MDKLASFQGQPVSYIETMQVKTGVECDVYSFNDDTTQDLAIVRVAQGAKTPLQKILQGDSTVEGFLSGKGMLAVQHEDGSTKTYEFNAEDTKGEVEVKIGQVMQWVAATDSSLTFYEICKPTYKDGRFEDLAE